MSTTDFTTPSSKMTFDNVIIVIGASQGIGRHIVKQLGKAFKSPAWKVNKVNYQLY